MAARFSQTNKTRFPARDVIRDEVRDGPGFACAGKCLWMMLARSRARPRNCEALRASAE